jgi:hypothetical protein
MSGYCNCYLGTLGMGSRKVAEGSRQQAVSGKVLGNRASNGVLSEEKGNKRISIARLLLPQICE